MAWRWALSRLWPPLAMHVAPAAAQSVDGGEIADFYRARGGAPLWFAPRSGAAAQQLLQLLATAQADNLNSRRYNVQGLTRAVQDAQTGNPAAIQRAEAMLSAAFVAYARDQSAIRAASSMSTPNCAAAAVGARRC